MNSDVTEILAAQKAAVAQLTAAGAPFELIDRQVNGVPLRCFKQAPTTLRDALAEGRKHGERICVTYEQERFSFDELFIMVDKLANHLVNHYQLCKGDRVAIAMRNYPEWMAAYIATVSLGAIVVPLNSWAQPDELEYLLSDAGAKLVFTDQQRAGYLADRLERLQCKAVVVRGDISQLGDGFDSFESTQSGPADMPDIDIASGDLAMIMYTSGTTGKPKGAASTHFAICQALYNMEMNAYASAMANPDTVGKMMSSGHEPATLLAVPLFHVSGCYAVFMLNLRGGRKTSIMYKWNPEEALRIIESERISVFTGVPAMTIALLESPAFASTDTSSLFSMGAGGTASPPHLKDLIYEKLPDAYPGTGYGMTETNATGSSFTGEAYRLRPEASGLVSVIVDCKTVDENGNDLPPGSTGEFYLRSPTNVQQYWNLPEATAETFRDGWVATGDVGYIDEEGFLYVVDRIKDMVIRGGENIYPIEVEGLLLTHPAVHEAAVYGVPHDTWGEELAATVYADPAVNADELKAFLAPKLAAYKVPEYITVSDTPLVKNATGKLIKKEIRQDYLDSL